MVAKIPKRVSTAILNSLRAGVVPRIGLPYIAVGRTKETETLVNDLTNISAGGACFRFVVGRYGSGKSFMLQLIRNNALDRNFVVLDGDLSPERRLAGGKGQGLATYRELMQNIATKTRPEGGALGAILERWISGVQSQVLQETGLRPSDAGFNRRVETQIHTVIDSMEGLVHGFDFANVLTTYWNGYQTDNDVQKNAALRWLRGEYSTKTEARQYLEVRVIIDDDSWYDYLKLIARFIVSIGYEGLVVLIDEAVNLYKINHSVTRQMNYEKVLTLFNDTMQGRAENLGIIMGGTPQFLEDERRGLYSYDALRTRLVKSRFADDQVFDGSDPVIHLQSLTQDEIFLLLQKIAEIHRIHYQYETQVSSDDLVEFMQVIVNVLGANQLLTPRDVVKDFLTLLYIWQESNGASFTSLLQSSKFQPAAPLTSLDQDEDDEFAEFTL